MDYDVWGGSWGASWGGSWGVTLFSWIDFDPNDFETDYVFAALQGGKGDNGPDVRRILKPTGLGGFKKKKGPTPTPEERVAETEEIYREVSEESAAEFIGEYKPIERMSMAEVEAEIGMLLRKTLRTEQDDILLLILMAAVV